MGKATILVIEDEEKQRRVVGLHLAAADYEVKGAGTAEEGWKLAGDVDLILTDLKLPGMDGLELLEKLKAQNSHTPVVVMSAFSTVENAVEAMKRGAVDFLPKPFSLDHLSVVVEKGARSQQAARRKSRTARSSRPALPVRKHHRQQPRHAGNFRHHHARGAHPRHRAAGRRKRRRQRT